MIKIKQNGNGDTRTARKDIVIDDVMEASQEHVKSVREALEHCAKTIQFHAENHDITKFTAAKMFYDDMRKTLDEGADFTKGEWYQMHIRAERHHPMSYCHDDINLFDILEMVCDCVCAGLARSGEVRGTTISNEILQKAVKNTAKLIEDNCLTV
jgi:hypothetical protein